MDAPESAILFILDILDAQNKATDVELPWKVLKTRLVHVHSGIVLNFLRSKTECGVPIQDSYGSRTIGELLITLGKKSRVVESVLYIRVDDDTVSIIGEILGS